MELSEDDKKYILDQHKNNSVHQYLQNVVPHNFKVGDFLIRRIREVDMNGSPKSDWRTVKIHPRSNINKKYMVVHVDECNVPYIKHIRVNGDLAGIICMASVDYRMSRFELDPEHMEHIILDKSGDFDPHERHKEQKNETN